MNAPVEFPLNQREAESDFFTAKLENFPDQYEKALLAVRLGSRHTEVLKAYVREAYKRGVLEELLPFEKPLSQTAALRRLYANIKSNAQLLRYGFDMPRPEHSEELGTVDRHRVLYFLHNSLPIDSGGYATRTHGLLKGISENGFRISGITRLGYPADRGEKYSGKSYPDLDVVNGIAYYRNQGADAGLGSMPMVAYLKRNLLANIPIVRRERPAIIHAASNYINGVTANFLAKKFGVKSVYEVRGLWEITRASREGGYAESDAYRQYARMEAETCRNADHVLALTGALKDILIDRGVPGEKITIVPNGVDSDIFVPLERNVQLAAKLGISETDVVVGYLGSVVDYEGIDHLVKAFRMLKRRGVSNARLLIVGDGAELANVVTLAKEMELGSAVIFTGRVPHSEIPDYYSLVDIAPFPRKPLPVTEAVSPLKPFEALAMAKCVIASNVRALDEIILEGETGLKFAKGDVDSLAATLEIAILNPELRKRLGETGLTWVRANRDWRQISSKITEVYRALIY